jgi:hypothetical protein
VKSISPEKIQIGIISFCSFGRKGGIVAPVGTWTLSMAGTMGDWGFHLEEFQESSGMFYVDKGTVNLYSATWKTIIYINLREENLERLVASLYGSRG